ncbi:isochorismatase family domain-containing protein [Purpureocillium lavendulum]|uniref:Isochorismatase family domain-containing protein n=1 Tax=Purpureocillium lavendulum TaxID=1247861 RepID=A0AB34FS07_9HYPO|nr:isochorismatase family domain-containing protein [Purpureocillium lavendulum]
MTATKLVYQVDEALRSYSTRVASVQPLSSLDPDDRALFKASAEDDTVVVTEETIFYAQGGGQPFDTGCSVLHLGRLVDGSLSSGEPIEQTIDSDRRDRNSRLHTGGHVVALAVRKHLLAGAVDDVSRKDLVELGASHYPDSAFVNFQGTIEASHKEAIQAQVSAYVDAALPVKVYFWSEDELRARCAAVPDAVAIQEGVLTRAVDIEEDEPTMSTNTLDVSVTKTTDSPAPKGAEDKVHHHKNGKKIFHNPWPSWHELDPEAVKAHLKQYVLVYCIPFQVPHLSRERFSTGTPDVRATWLGHACYLVEFPSGLRVLFDPVMTDRCSPSQWFGPRRFTQLPCDVKDLPYLDAVVISHNHYDHLSHPTVVEIAKEHPQAQFFVPLGNESWFHASGIHNVTELDWWEGADLTITSSSQPESGAESIRARITCLPAQHTTGRAPWGTDKTLWASWSVASPLAGAAVPGSAVASVFFGGDTGYRAVPTLGAQDDDWDEKYADLPVCPAFGQIGELYGPFTLGLLPIGAAQYDPIMAPTDRNPVQVQYYAKGKKGAEEPAGPAPAPLVLIHDGGGTTFAYFTVGRLGRDVWAIHSPTFMSAQPWEGGMDGMARHYISLIEEVAGIKGRILLGGWSLGGYVALTMSHIIATSPESFGIAIDGILMMDSPWLVAGRDLPIGTPQPALIGIPDLVRKSLDNCERMLYHWELPQWGLGSDRSFTFSSGKQSLEIPPGTVLYRSLKGDWRPVERKGRHELTEQQTHQTPPSGPPPTVMLRSVVPAPTKGSSGKPCRVDQFRDELLLGWDGRYNSEMIHAVMEARSHHYDMFNQLHVEEITDTIKLAIEILETIEPGE